MKTPFVPLFLLTAGLLSAAPAFAEIREATRMDEIRPYLAENTWIVFDLDNTVMEPAQTLGSDQWFDSLIRQTGSVDEAVAAWSKVQARTAVRAVEATTPALIQELQAKGFHVFALTARPESLAPVTLRQLASLGVRFGKVLSVGPKSSKGEALVREIEAAAKKPSRVVFVDDKVKHVKSVDEALTAAHVENFEFRYGAADPEVKAFDETLVAKEYEIFLREDRVISDAEARRLLSSGFTLVCDDGAIFEGPLKIVVKGARARADGFFSGPGDALFQVRYRGLAVRKSGASQVISGPGFSLSLRGQEGHIAMTSTDEDRMPYDGEVKCQQAPVPH